MTTLVRRAFVSAAAAALGVGLGHALVFDHVHWAVITALTLLAPSADGTARRTLWRILGTTGCALWVVALYGATDPQPEVIIAVCGVAVIAGFALMPHVRAQYAAFLFLPLGAGFALEALTDPAGAPALVGYRVFFIATGSLMVALFSALLRCQRAPAPPPPPPPLAESVLHALRIALAATLAMFFAALAERSDLAPMMVITIMVLGTMTTAEASRGKGILRFGGALVGGSVAVAYYVFLLDMATSIYSLMTIVFVVTWFSALLLGIPSIAYLGIQTGFVFAWSIGEGSAPAGDVWVPLERMLQVGAATLILMAVYRLRVPAHWVGRLADGLRRRDAEDGRVVATR